MKDTEKMIEDMNKITEDDYKLQHIFMWEFVIERIKDASLVSLSNNKDICLHEVKEEYLKKVKALLEEKEFLVEKDKWILKKINNCIYNDCWACQYILDETYQVSCCSSCPLLEDNKGKLSYNCKHLYSNYVLLKVALNNYDYDKALKLATEIKDAWREVK